jgi:hypothetical protein
MEDGMSKAIVFVGVLVSGVMVYAIKTYEPILLHAVKAYEYAKLCHEAGPAQIPCFQAGGPPDWGPPPSRTDPKTYYELYANLGHGEQIRADLQVDWLKTRLTKADECLRDELIACGDDRACADRALAKHKRRTDAQEASFTNMTGLPLPSDERYSGSVVMSATDCAAYFKESMFDDLQPDTPKPKP